VLALTAGNLWYFAVSVDASSSRTFQLVLTTLSRVADNLTPDSKALLTGRSHHVSYQQQPTQCRHIMQPSSYTFATLNLTFWAQNWHTGYCSPRERSHQFGFFCAILSPKLYEQFLYNLTLEDAIEMALDKPLWGLLAASGATHWWCMPNNDDDDDVPFCIHDRSPCGTGGQTDRWPRPIVWPIRTWWQFSVSDLPLVVIYWTSTWFIQFAKISAMQWFKKMGDLQKPVVDVTNSLMEEKLRGDCNCVNNFCCSTVYMIIDCMYLL